jgi:hypothetical protein
MRFLTGDNRYRKLISVAVCVMVLFALLMSYFFVATELHHDCCGEDCPICATIDICVNTIKQLGNAVGTIVFVLFVSAVTHNLHKLYVYHVIPHTLVSRKVRLNP